MKNAYDIIVIGGGPCGIASVVEAKVCGIKNVLLLEKGDNHSQTLRQFYKDNKRVDKEYKGLESQTRGSVDFQAGTKESTLDYFDKLLDNEEIDTAFKSEVEKVDKREDGLFYVVTSNATYTSKNVIVCVGRMGKPNKPSYKIPPSITQRVNFNLDKCGQNEKILVVGGGNSAIEYAIALSNMNIVTLCYRKDKFTRLNDINYKAIEQEARYGNVILKMNTDIQSLENEGGKVLVNFINSNPIIYDRVVYAIGGSTPIDFLKKCNIQVDEDGVPVVNDKCESNITNLYVGGDLISKNGGSIVVAFNHAHTIVQSIKDRL